jgi:hypothetical protein
MSVDLSTITDNVLIEEIFSRGSAFYGILDRISDDDLMEEIENRELDVNYKVDLYDAMADSNIDVVSKYVEQIYDSVIVAKCIFPDREAIESVAKVYENTVKPRPGSQEYFILDKVKEMLNHV